MTAKTTRSHKRRPFAQQLRKLLSAEGYRPRLDQGDGQPSTIHFKVEGDEFQLCCWEDDPGFVQLCTGRLLGGATHDEPTLLRAANEVQAKVKVVKVWLPASGEFVEFQVELFLSGHPLSPELLQRCISTLRYAVGELTQRVIPEVPRALA